MFKYSKCFTVALCLATEMLFAFPHCPTFVLKDSNNQKDKGFLYIPAEIFCRKSFSAEELPNVLNLYRKYKSPPPFAVQFGSYWVCGSIANYVWGYPYFQHTLPHLIKQPDCVLQHYAYQDNEDCLVGLPLDITQKDIQNVHDIWNQYFIEPIRAHRQHLMEALSLLSAADFLNVLNYTAHFFNDLLMDKCGDLSLHPTDTWSFPLMCKSSTFILIPCKFSAKLKISHIAWDAFRRLSEFDDVASNVVKLMQRLDPLCEPYLNLFSPHVTWCNCKDKHFCIDVDSFFTLWLYVSMREQNVACELEKLHKCSEAYDHLLEDLKISMEEDVCEATDIVVEQNHGQVVFDQPGKYFWAIPEGVHTITIEAIGAGGSGSPALQYRDWGTPVEQTSDLNLEYHSWRGWIWSKTPIYVTGPARITNVTGRMSRFPATSNEFLVYRTDNPHNLPRFNQCVELKDKETRNFVLNMIYNDRKQKDYVYSYGVSFSHNVTENQVNENSWMSKMDARTKSQKNMRIYLDVQYLTDFSISGNGGGSGTFRMEKIEGVQSGGIVSIHVGQASELAAGEATTVHVHSLEIRCDGGAMGVPATRGSESHYAGQQVAMLGQFGNGGNGQKDYKTQERLAGQNGCVRIRW
ncbi:MAG: hypothetical protein LBJ78_00795 [Puniceicoccales bacterium]|jgi:hypothetical protein|nr:hypothetical protein [Puniceicoccales bacterium]